LRSLKGVVFFVNEPDDPSRALMYNEFGNDSEGDADEYKVDKEEDQKDENKLFRGPKRLMENIASHAQHACTLQFAGLLQTHSVTSIYTMIHVQLVPEMRTIFLLTMI
jgi:hypothetical protein